MPCSMTGYGRGQCESCGRKFVVEIRSVNHRYNDVSIKLPRTMFAFEDPIRKYLSAHVFRGKTDVYVRFESSSEDDVTIAFDEALADCLHDSLETIKERYGLKDEIGLSMISRFPEVLTISKEFDEEDLSLEGRLWKTLREALEKATSALLSMRSEEGQFLKKDILSKAGTLEGLLNKISERAPFVSEDHRIKLLHRIKAFVDGQIDETRILTEVAIFADRFSIDEELKRFESHLLQMKLILAENNPIGRKLDFLVQEMNREANTITSKANDADITAAAVIMKNEIEKIREQVQNIE